MADHDNGEQHAGAEEPEVFALHREGSAWQIGRRGFLGLAASAGAALTSQQGQAAGAETADSVGKMRVASHAHQDAILTLGLSADGKTLVSASSDMTAKL